MPRRRGTVIFFTRFRERRNIDVPLCVQLWYIHDARRREFDDSLSLIPWNQVDFSMTSRERGADASR